VAGLGLSVDLACLAAAGPVPGVTLNVLPQWRRPARFAVSPAMARALRDAADDADIVHNHSLWSMTNVAAGWVVPGRRAKLVASPRGTLSAWALGHSHVAKRLLWPLQRRALDRADLLHATSLSEVEEIRSLGLRAPVVLIPNGIDVPGGEPVEAPSAGRTLLFLSRIHPKKGIDRLLHAWVALERAHPDWRLVVAGSGEPAHVEEVVGMARALALDRVSFPGPVFGAAKAQAYATASLFVLPTHSENFGMVVAEALAAGLPAVVSKGAPWSGLPEQGAGWWVDGDVEPLGACLDAAMRLPPRELARMGASGRAWMQREFGWDEVARRMADAYGWLLTGGAPPPQVMLP
jgi:glycosyltransferase involved in cell wall biosynthesis